MQAIDSSSLVAKHVVWNERLARYVTKAQASGATKYELEMMTATFCASCRTKAVVNAVCRSCGLHQSETDCVKWE